MTGTEEVCHLEIWVVFGRDSIDCFEGIVEVVRSAEVEGHQVFEVELLLGMDMFVGSEGGTR